MALLRFPFEPDARGRSRNADDATHVRDMIEQVLFTVPGERVNRPDFGCGLLQLVFARTATQRCRSTCSTCCAKASNGVWRALGGTCHEPPVPQRQPAPAATAARPAAARRQRHRLRGN
ncbi:GPW/gp25 family protein [Achromobacter animicus]|uniref:GPW/gp25 family protein n=1 Tax=Achromobacter animicus TaxID=1389935 RepID=UPI0028AB04EB|nr:GPW/gp25 family protein [Achromobacter animicus]